MRYIVKGIMGMLGNCNLAFVLGNCNLTIFGGKQARVVGDSEIREGKRLAILPTWTSTWERRLSTTKQAYVLAHPSFNCYDEDGYNTLRHLLNRKVRVRLRSPLPYTLGNPD